MCFVVRCRRLWWYHLSLSVSRSDSACALSWQSPVCLTSCKAAWEASLNAYVLAALLAVGYGPTGDISPHTRISHLLGSILKAVGRCPERQKSGHPLESCIATCRLRRRMERADKCSIHGSPAVRHFPCRRDCRSRLHPDPLVSRRLRADGKA